MIVSEANRRDACQTSRRHRASPTLTSGAKRPVRRLLAQQALRDEQRKVGVHVPGVQTRVQRGLQLPRSRSHGTDHHAALDGRIVRSSARRTTSGRAARSPRNAALSQAKDVHPAGISRTPFLDSVTWRAQSTPRSRRRACGPKVRAPALLRRSAARAPSGRPRSRGSRRAAPVAAVDDLFQESGSSVASARASRGPSRNRPLRRGRSRGARRSRELALGGGAAHGGGRRQDRTLVNSAAQADVQRDVDAPNTRAVEQRVAGQPVGSMDTGTRHLACGEQTGNGCPASMVHVTAAHQVVCRRTDRYAVAR